MIIKSTCPRDCYDTCSILTTVEDGKVVKLEGNPTHPVTQGFICWKIKNSPKFVYSPDRLLYPMKRVGPKGEAKFERISWDEAFSEIAARFGGIIQKHGPEAILPFHYFGHMGLLTTHAAQRIFNALGTGKCSQTVCSMAGRMALKYVYGSYWGVDPENMAASKLIIFWGLNGPWSNLHGYNMAKKAVRDGAKFYLIDPVKTATLGTHLQIRPNTDGALALGLANYIISNDLYDKESVRRYAHGFEPFAEAVKDFTLEKTSRITRLPQQDIVRLARDLVELRPSFIHAGFGVQKHLNGGEAVRAIALLPVLVGSLRIQYSNTDRDVDLGFLQGAQFLKGQRKVYNMARLGKILEEGSVKGLFVFNTNPVVNLPNQGLVRQGLASEDVFTVVHDLFLNDTCDYADVILPATSFLENFDAHACYYHNYMSVNERAVTPLGECRPNYQMFKGVAEAMGLDADQLYPPEEDVLREFMDRSAAIDFSLEDLRGEGFRKMAVKPQDHFPTPSGRVEFYSQLAERDGLPPLPGHYEDDTGGYPLQLITANEKHITRSQFHIVWQKEVEAGVLLNKDDAAARGIADGDRVRLRNKLSELVMDARLSDNVSPGVALAYGGIWAKLTGGCSVNALIPDYVQPFGGNAAYNSTYIEIEKRQDS
ncbi:MAG: molybdopterin-dependent oxidoreductase [Planctomycetes bacterium]|nr:molybdopterin-dependent oxidoreductase [Planctomycetota bacterium]